MPPLKIAPSLLAADFGQLNTEIASIEPHAQWLHIDVMDGHFVPNLTIGAPVVRALKTKLLKDCHLMVANPAQLLNDFAAAGAGAITIHAEAVSDLPKLLAEIKALKILAGVSIKPATPIAAITDILDTVDLVLVMSVEPGFGGQEFLESALPKIRELRKLKPELDISVDGGINSETAALSREAGANILVAGSAIFGADDRVKAIEELRG